jgi:hypothetical protein
MITPSLVPHAGFHRMKTSNCEKRSAMKESFDGLKKDIDEAREFLRSFTLGRPGFTQRDGTTAINRVRELSDRLQQGFLVGKHNKEVAQAAASAQGQILAANARLDLLRR